MIHERFDLEYWKRIFPLDRLRREARAYFEQHPRRLGYEVKDPETFDYLAVRWRAGSMITGPSQVAIMEQWRDQEFPAGLPGPRLPTDIFVFAEGEAPRREVTKAGGLPYRSAGRPWPHAPSGRPMTFVTQFCFADSFDLVGPLPGDILLVFVDKESFGRASDDSVILEWVNLGEPNLVEQADIPVTDWEIVPCYAAIHRSWDLPLVDWCSLDEIPDDVRHQYMGNPTTVHTDQTTAIPEPRFTPYGILEATKIGGLPFWTQDAPAWDRHLCTSSSIWPLDGAPFPLLNITGPITWDQRHAYKGLLWGDVGQLNICVDAEGKLRWDWDCC